MPTLVSYIFYYLYFQRLLVSILLWYSPNRNNPNNYSLYRLFLCTDFRVTQLWTNVRISCYRGSRSYSLFYWNVYFHYVYQQKTFPTVTLGRRHRPPFRIITRYPYHEIAYGDDLDALRTSEWKYVVFTRAFEHFKYFITYLGSTASSTNAWWSSGTNRVLLLSFSLLLFLFDYYLYFINI